MACWAILLLCAACGSHSLEDYREEGQNTVKSLIQEMQRIKTREELVAASPKLKRQFQELTSVIIAAHEFREKHPDSEMPELSEESHFTSEQLRSEMNRLYRLEGGRDIVEKCQEEALLRLDAAIKKAEGRRKKAERK